MLEATVRGDGTAPKIYDCPPVLSPFVHVCHAQASELCCATLSLRWSLTSPKRSVSSRSRAAAAAAARLRSCRCVARTLPQVAAASFRAVVRARRYMCAYCSRCSAVSGSSALQRSNGRVRAGNSHSKPTVAEFTCSAACSPRSAGAAAGAPSCAALGSRPPRAAPCGSRRRRSTAAARDGPGACGASPTDPAVCRTPAPPASPSPSAP